LLVGGTIHRYPLLGYIAIAATALNGITVLRMYFALFCGRRDPLAGGAQGLGLRRREAWTFASLVFVLVIFGLAPRPIVDSRLAAGHAILQLREERLRRGEIPALNLFEPTPPAVPPPSPRLP
jgi:NADH:ubiquinone oxidoreductase subunit 4 (subunit M)